MTDLKNKIEKKREEMIKVASINGMDSLKTIKVSQELDQLLAEYQKKLLPPE